MKLWKFVIPAAFVFFCGFSEAQTGLTLTGYIKSLGQGYADEPGLESPNDIFLLFNGSGLVASGATSWCNAFGVYRVGVKEGGMMSQDALRRAYALLMLAFTEGKKVSITIPSAADCFNGYAITVY